MEIEVTIIGYEEEKKNWELEENNYWMTLYYHKLISSQQEMKFKVLLKDI